MKSNPTLNETRHDPLRVADRVAQGGHHIPEPVVRRRLGAGIANFHGLYKPLVNAWRLYDNSGEQPDLIESSDLP